jgi:hypothetical protein
VSWITGAVNVGLWAAFLTLAVTYIGMCVPGITPAKFRYRPLWFFYGRVKPASAK